jgi:BA14K-like protein
MINLKVLSTAAAMAVVLPMLAPGESFAQGQNGGRGAPAGAVRGGGGGGAPAARFGGGGGAPQAFRGGSPQAFNGGGIRSGGYGGYRQGGGVGGGAPVAQYGGGGGWRGNGGWHGDYDGRRRDRDAGFIPGAVAGAVIGGAVASSYGYYGGPGYYDSPGYYDDQYYDDSVVAAAPAPAGDDAVGYCMQTYQSYDPASGTYLGYDGLRHPCP